MNASADPESSLELLERARDGDAAASDRLLTRYLRPLQRWASGRLPRWARDLSDTGDLVQETLVQTLRNIGTFRPRREGALPLDRAIGRETVERYEAALAELRDEDREAIVARVELGQSWEEVATMLDKQSPAAARVATQRALVRLAVKMNHAR
jgi:RNA polymerase sigma-70 factor, ECF subfamily